MPVSFGDTAPPDPRAPPPPPLRGAPVVVDASAVVVVDGSSTMVGSGRAVEVLVDSPITRPFSVREPPEQAPVTKAIATARPMAPVLLKVCWVRMGKWPTFPER